MDEVWWAVNNTWPLRREIVQKKMATDLHGRQKIHAVQCGQLVFSSLSLNLRRNENRKESGNSSCARQMFVSFFFPRNFKIRDLVPRDCCWWLPALTYSTTRPQLNCWGEQVQKDGPLFSCGRRDLPLVTYLIREMFVFHQMSSANEWRTCLH